MKRIFLNKKELIDAYVEPTHRVLDVGYAGQGIKEGDPHWVHGLILNRAAETYGVDLENLIPAKGKPERYKQASAESFVFDEKMDRIVAADLIEHLSNPGLFLDACKRTLASGGLLVLTTPNCFNLFNMTEKMMKDEPTVNSDHTCYFNRKTLSKLLEKNGWEAVEIGYVYDMGIAYRESLKKKVLNGLYALLGKATPKFLETLVVVARVKMEPKTV